MERLTSPRIERLTEVVSEMRGAMETWHLVSIPSLVEHIFRGLRKLELVVEYLKTGETSQDEELLSVISLAQFPLLVHDLEGGRGTGGTKKVGRFAGRHGFLFHRCPL